MADINENRSGYKKTKVGWIPEEWQVYKVGSILKESKLGGNYTNQSEPTNRPLVKMGNINRGTISLNNIMYIPEEISVDENDLLQEGDLLFNTRNTLELVGKVAIWRKELPIAYYNSNLLRLKFKATRVVSNYFMNYLFNSHKSLSQLSGFATGTTSVAAIYNRDLYKLKLPLPPLPEQKKIAAILSTWDVAIRKLDQLIERKQTLKKGLMQQLLTGQRRFPEFVPPGGTRYRDTKLGKVPEDWEVVKLGEVFKERKETGFEDSELLSIGNDGIYPQSESDKRDISNSNKSRYKRILPGDIGYNTMRMWQGRSAVSELEGIVSPAYTIIKPNKDVDIKFAGYFFKLPAVIYLFWRYSQGMVADTLNLKYKNFAEIKLPWPSKREQVTIAEALSFLDVKIEKLETKKEQLEIQKKGLMQQLLTGAVRVKV